MEVWGAARYGDPCRGCGYDWSITSLQAVQLVAGIPTGYGELLAGTDGSQRHPDLEWTAGAYVCHVTDNLRLWAERLAGAATGGSRAVPGTTRTCSPVPVPTTGYPLPAPCGHCGTPPATGRRRWSSD